MAGTPISLELEWRFQNNPVNCGPAALRNALLCYGVRADIRRIARLAGTSGADSEDPGTDEKQLRLAATQLGFRLEHVACATWELTKANLLAYSRSGTPVICITERWKHWVCVVRSNARYVHVVDSQRDSIDPLRRYTWTDFGSLSVLWRPPNDTQFHLYPVLPAVRG